MLFLLKQSSPPSKSGCDYTSHETLSRHEDALNLKRRDRKWQNKLTLSVQVPADPKMLNNSGFSTFLISWLKMRSSILFGQNPNHSLLPVSTWWMLFGLHALIKDAQTAVCLPRSSIFISGSLNQRSDVSLGRPKKYIWAQISASAPSRLYRANHTSVNKTLKTTPPVWNLMTQQEAKTLILISFFCFNPAVACLVWDHKAGLWLVSREPSLLKESTNMHPNMLICWLDHASSWKRRRVILYLCFTVRWKGHELRGYFSCVSMEISTCRCWCSLRQQSSDLIVALKKTPLTLIFTVCM